MYSIDTYKQILSHALQQGRRFRGFEDKIEKGAIILRHDIDYSLEMAIDMARINHELGIRGTFFILLRSQIYNLISDQSLARVRKILDLNQYVALHSNGHHLDTVDVAKTIEQEFKIFQQYIPEIRPVFSWHNPEHDVIDRYKKDKKIAGLINAYSYPLIEEIRYMADSNMRYSVEEFIAALSAHRDEIFQLLMHPFQWVARESDMIKILAKTWQYVIREREEDFLYNRIYKAKRPEGVSDATLALWTEAVKKDFSDK